MGVEGKNERLTLVVLLVGLSLSVGACSNAKDHWQEEVQLSDGRVIVVERDLLRERGGDEWAFNRSGSKPKQYVIRFSDPVEPNKTMVWQSIKMDRQTWPELPLVLDFEEEKPVIYSIVATSPCEVYTKYVHVNGAWIEEALPEIFEMRLTNLVLKPGGGQVDLEMKAKINNNVGYRKSIKQVGPKRQICQE